MNGSGKSDRPIVPGKSPNKGRGAPRPAEEMEGRGLTKGNPRQQTRHRAQNRERLQQALRRVRQAACKDKGLRFTTLWHHVYDVDRLREAYFSLKRKAAAGVDGVTWQAYGERLEENLGDLAAKLKRGAYRAKPVQRAYVPKMDGRQRPIGIPTLEDKVVQHAAAEVLGAVYEADFKGFSYGFRPGRSQHNALDALVVGIERRKVNWILDADIRSFYDTIDWGWLVKFIEHRIADQRVVRHVKKWLKAGVLEDGKRIRVEAGTPQGGSISPLLSNVYLHYVFDLWVEQWRRKRARGDVIVVRYADDVVLGFEHRDEAVRFQADLSERLRQFNLELHPDKTRLAEFGRFAAERRKRRGQGKPETFDFLGFTHICGQTRAGGFKVRRKTMRKKMCAKLKEVKDTLRRRMHHPIPEVGRWLNSVVSGHYRYYGVPGNSSPMSKFRYEVVRHWRRVLSQRSQKGYVTWARMTRVARRWLSTPRICHPYPDQRLCVTTQGRSPVR